MFKRIVRERKGNEAVSLSTLRKGLGKSQVYVAERLGISQSEISRIEHRSDMKLSTITKYLAALGASCELSIVFKNGKRVIISK